MISFTKETSSFLPVSTKAVSKFAAFALAAVLGLSMVQSAFAASDPKFDKNAFLSAIAEVETGGDPYAVGRQGERGLYQFRSGVWKQYTNRSFFQAHNPDVAFGVAVKHFNWLYDGFIRNGLHPNAYMMAAAWNGGLNRALSGRLTKGTRNYARRVANIVTLAEARQVTTADPGQVSWGDSPRFALAGTPYVRFRTSID